MTTPTGRMSANTQPQRLSQHLRFLLNVEKSESCWIWDGPRSDPRSERGYGRFPSEAGQAAHRYAWHYYNGPIPDGMLVLHRCDNPPCVNPDHLFLGTAADNTHDMLSKDRHKGRITADLVRQIRTRLAEGESGAAVGRRFGLSRLTVSQIKTGRTFAWVA